MLINIFPWTNTEYHIGTMQYKSLPDNVQNIICELATHFGSGLMSLLNKGNAIIYLPGVGYI